MCGIAGIFAYRDRAPKVDREELLRIREAMTKRGPDGAGLWISNDGRVGLAHRRLAIIDLSASGAQPMATADGRLHIIFNGEIYNYKGIRSELVRKGYRFQSTSDTEVLLHLYADRGAEMVHSLRGMYTFAIWDERDRSLFLARDPFGVKPLYYADDGIEFRFASQVKALIAGKRVSERIDPAAQVGFEVLGHVPEPHTTYRAIKALPAGSTLRVRSGHMPQLSRFFDIRSELEKAESGSVRVSGKEPGHELVEALRDSVRHHMVSDVPVGLFLSSGIDSISVACTASELGPTALRSITLGFKEFDGSVDDETILGARAAAHLGVRHAIDRISAEDFYAEREHLLASMDQPTIDGVNTYFVARAAARAGMKVALSGLGGDELFGGYPSFIDVPRIARGFRFASRIPALGRAARIALAPVLSRFTSPKYAGLLEYGGTWGGAYMLRRGLHMPWELDEILDPAVIKEGWEALGLISRLNETPPSDGGDFARVCALETEWYMRNQLLRDTDWAAMAHSVEVRVPFVDVEIFRRVVPLVVSGRVSGKTVLARALAPRFPQELIERRKTGFSTPVRQWLVRQDPSARHRRGLKGWAKHVAGAQLRGPKRILISTLVPGHGGVATMTRKIIDFLQQRRYEVGIAYYMPYRIAPRLSVPFWQLPWKVPRLRTAVAFGDISAYEIGVRLPELEAARCFPSTHWRRVARHYDCHIAVSGSVLVALPLVLQHLRCLAWIATPYLEDKVDRARRYPIYRRIVDRLIDTPLCRRLERVGLGKVDVLALSRYTATAMERIAPGSNPTIMSMPIDTQRFHPEETVRADGFSVGFSGRFNDPRKNIDLLLEAVALLCRRGHDVICHLVGDTPSGTILEKVNTLGLDGKVHFWGHRPHDQLNEFYNSLDAFIIPSYQEGLGIVGLEAMACGRPVVATRCGGTEDYVKDGLNGFLVDFDATEMATAIDRLRGSPDLLKQLGKAALDTVHAEYSEERIAGIFWNKFDARFDIKSQEC